ncbi:MAG: tetratricopeptide repeat protein [Chloroflexota bacterium]|nr:tetratricopeptide repeat protein [Chloroflexota bacterium]
MMARSKKDKRAKQRAARLRLNGLKALKRGDYDDALEIWESIQPNKFQPAEGIVEAYFRRGIERFYGKVPQPEAGLEDLKKAYDLNSKDACYALHFGLAAHHQGKLEEAIDAYQVAFQSDDNKFTKRAAYPLALALQQQDQSPLEHPVWDVLESEMQGLLENVRTFSRRPYKLTPGAPMLWQGIVALDQGEEKQVYDMLTNAIEIAVDPIEKGLGHYYLGVLAMKQENVSEARKHWTMAHSMGLQTPHLQHNLGQVYHEIAEAHLDNDDVESALAAAKESNRHKTQNSLDELMSQAYQRMAYQAAAAGNWQEAKSDWKQAYDLEDGSFRQIYNIALANEHDKDFIAAGEAWREALRRRPRRDDHPDAISDEDVSKLWKRAAEAYEKAGDFDEAIHVYQQAVKYSPDSLETRHQLAHGLANAGRVQAAENEYDRILERSPNNIKALLRRGELAESTGYWWRSASSTHYWERVLDIDPENAEARQLLANHYIDRAEESPSWAGIDRILESYKKALEYQPNNGEALAGMAYYYLQDEEEEQAQKYIDQALETASGNLIVYQEIISIWLQNQYADRAWQVLEFAETKNINIPHTFYKRIGAFCFDYLDAQDAQPWLERAEEAAPAGYPILTSIGIMAMSFDEPDIGKEYLQRALDADQQPGWANFYLGIYHVETDNYKEAEKNFRKASWIARKERDYTLRDCIKDTETGYLPSDGLFDSLF